MPKNKSISPKEKIRLAVIDDEPIVCRRLTQIFSRRPFQVETFEAAEPALRRMETHPFQLVLSDIRLPDRDGLDVLQRIREKFPRTQVILMTGYATLDQAVEAVKQGAFYYLAKPFTPDRVLAVTDRALELLSPSEENQRLREEFSRKPSAKGFVGISSQVKELLQAIDKVSRIDCSVLIQGESGTGKELVARSIHQLSQRREYPFIDLNCGGFSEELIANELFGHEKGAFTGADSTKIGLMEAAQGGTLFLDEIEEMPGSMQVKLLRVIQERKIFRVGGVKPIRLDIRIISATNRELEKEVKEGRFREDLFYRLKVVLIKVPPMRERKEDIPVLLNYFVEKFNQAYKKKVRGFSREALDILMRYSFPGNVRELENIVASAVALSEGDLIGPPDLPEDLKQFEVESLGGEQWLSWEDQEKNYIRKILESTSFNKQKAASILKMSRTTLWRKLTKYGLIDQ